MAFVLAIPVTNWLMHMYAQGCTNTHTYTTATKNKQPLGYVKPMYWILLEFVVIVIDFD